MSLIKFLMVMVALSLFQAPLAYSQSKDRRVKRTQARQAKRIARGVQNGSLTKKETGQLVRQQRRINRARKRAASDGDISNQEMAKIRARQARASKRIFRKKHNQKEQSDSE